MVQLGQEQEQEQEKEKEKEQEQEQEQVRVPSDLSPGRFASPPPLTRPPLRSVQKSNSHFGL